MKIAFKKQIYRFHDVVLEMHDVLFLIIGDLGASGAFWVGSCKVKYIQDFKARATHEVRGK